MTTTLDLPDLDAYRDLVTYLERAGRSDRASVRLVAANAVLAVYAAVLHPGGLMDGTPTVLGLRTVSVPRALKLDAVVPVASLVERLRLVGDAAIAKGLGDGATRSVGLPAEVHTVTWAGVAPPRNGWRSSTSIGADVLGGIARAGSAEVSATLPDGAGEHIVQRVRSEVWGRPIAGVDSVPAGAAFAAETLGFIPDPSESLTVYQNGPWTRLSAVRGHVLVKRRGWALNT